ncbi:diguanylate cyclase [Roseibium alexandrii]|uniref:diguanylate cyclase n=1 Tax=Roseibium alexandrii (strain DSM 17067 / NCIMB 14079 / DFL-11) TaxID=244592 RepID=A0A5E8H6H1_ROSAD|nr:diguanylate cyclase [Roseibium alexandrii]EEE47632.1 diguanylate cyclase (GGDEF) domain protein [Roseibium alexandrii DFL-11]
MDHLNRTALNASKLKKAALGLTIVYVVLMVLSFRFIDGEREARVNLELETRASELANRTAEILRFSVENLHAASGLITYMHGVTYSQFNALTDHYFEADPGLLIMEWQPIVKASDRAEFERKARENGLPNFQLWEPSDTGTPVVAQSRAEHVPVYLMSARYPDDNEINTLGLDLAWSPERMASKLHARDKGVAQSSGFFPIVLGPDDTASPLGFAITLPVYQSGIVPESKTARHEKILGYFAGVYSVQLLLEPALEELVKDGIGAEIYGRSNHSAGILTATDAPTSFERTIETALYGNTWTITLVASQAYVNGLKDPLLYLIPISLTSVFALVLVFMFFEERSKVRLKLAHGKLEQANRQLDALARQDALTGLANRRAFFDRLDQLLNELDRHPHPASFLMLDLDKFKIINDTRGHAAGDEVLKAFASLCQETVRKVDVVGRIGGEEFAILLPHTSAEDATVFAERLRTAVAAIRFSETGPLSGLTFTVSIGLSAISERIDARTWLSQADKALYQSKASGRNRVTVYQKLSNDDVLVLKPKSA